MSVEFDRGSPGKFDSRTLSRETLSRWTRRRPPCETSNRVYIHYKIVHMHCQTTILTVLHSTYHIVTCRVYIPISYILYPISYIHILGSISYILYPYVGSISYILDPCRVYIPNTKLFTCIVRPPY